MGAAEMWELVEPIVKVWVVEVWTRKQCGVVEMGTGGTGRECGRWRCRSRG